MNIAFVNDVVFPENKSGRARRLHEMTKRLAKNNEVHIYTMKWWDGPKDIVKDGIHFHAICKHKPLWVGHRRSIRQALYFSYKLFFPLLFSKADVIDCDQYPLFPCYTSKLASILKNVPMIITWHEVWGSYWNKYIGKLGYVARIFEWMTTRLTGNNLMNSDSTKQRFETMAKKPSKLLALGTKIQNSKDRREGVLFVGRIAKEKNLDMFLQVARILKREDVKCTIIGYGPDEERIKGLAESYGLNINFMGNVSDEILFRELRKHKYFFSASTREGFAIAVLEAMGSGTPPIVIDHPNNAASEIVPRELIVSNNKNAVADKILDISPGTYKRLSSIVRNKAKKFSWDNAANQYQNYVSRLINESN